MNELVELSRKLKKRHIYIDFRFWLQLHSATIKKVQIKNWVCEAKPKLAMFGKPFMNQLPELSCKLKKRHIYIDFGFWLQSHEATIKKIYKLKIEFEVHICVSYLV